MKNKKVLSLVLAFAMLLSSFLIAANADDGNAGEEKTGLSLNKTAIYNKTTNDYTITLEAYATGSKVISQTNKDVPTDIVLVLDQSGSMGFCINCGAEFEYNNWSSTSCVKYESVGTAANTTYNRSTQYYYYSSSGYKEAYYCSNSGGWHRGHNGWYEAPSRYQPNTHGDKLNNDVTLYQKVAGGTHEHRLDSLKTALTTFCTSVATKASTQVNHRIAMVGFSTPGDTYKNTELLTGVTLSDGSIYNGNSYYYYPTTTKINGAQYGEYGNNITQQQYSNALQDMSTTEGKTSVANAINALTAQGGTYTDDGLTMAEKIFDTYTIQTDRDGNPTRNRVVVLFTDGDTDDSRKDTINTAYALKNTYNATVYCVGIFDGANGTPVTSWDDVSTANRFMHLISSNFKNAQITGYLGDWDDIAATTNTYPANGSSYYLSASDTTSLNNIFQQIAGNINTDSTVTELDENTVIKDVVTQQFTMPENTSSIKVYTQESDGSETNWKARAEFTDAKVTVNEADRSISVTNFSFKDNWVGEESNLGETGFHNGKKLIIEFSVKAQDGFLGGNDVYTNTSAGVYKNANATTPEFTFNRPQVNVPIDTVTVTATDKNVYLLGSLTAEQIKSGATVKCGNVSLDLSKANNNHGLEAWQTEYVDITIAYTDSYGNTVTGLSDLKDDTTYTVTATVTPKTKTPGSTQGTVATEKSGSATGNINVFKPELTFKDSEVYYGDTAPTDYSGNKTSEVWKHGTTKSTDTGVTMTGTVPTLSLSYTPEADKISTGNKINTKSDFAVDVAVKIDGTDVTTSTSFKHTDCTGKTCGTPTNGKFWIHVKTCSLTISKAAQQGTTIGNDEYFVFNVKKDGQDYTQVTIKGTGSITIYELPVGTYTVAEDTSTAWRYTAQYSDGATATLSSGNPTGSITVTNTLENDHWLNHFTRVINTYGKATGEKN